jgi:transcriptional regulator NrdR family protein
MVCIHCGSRTQVINSRLQKRANQVWRRRRCTECEAVFTSLEAIHYELSWLVESQSGDLTPFSRDKLFLSIYESCKHRVSALQDAGALTDTIIAKLLQKAHTGVLRSQIVTQTVQTALNRFDRVASTHYNAFHKNN